MPEQYRTKKGQEPVRLTSTSGHVTNVGPDWKAVPAPLIPKADAAGLMSKSVYDELKADVVAELKAEDIAPGTEVNPKTSDESDPKDTETQEEAPKKADEPPVGAEKVKRVLLAIKEVKDLSDTGEESSPKGRKLLSSSGDRPLVDAVTEFAGFKVSAAEIDEALA